MSGENAEINLIRIDYVEETGNIYLSAYQYDSETGDLIGLVASCLWQNNPPEFPVSTIEVLPDGSVVAICNELFILG